MIAIDDATGTGRGSGRSIPGVNLHAALRECEDLMLGFGGHPMAAGMTIDGSRVDEFAVRLDIILAGVTPQEALVPERRIDGELAFDQLGEAAMNDLDRLEPYGTSNPEPTFLARNVRVRSRAVVGASHLKLLLESGGCRLAAIAFGMADRVVDVGDEIDILYRPRVSEWGGERTLEAELRDFRRS
jgi:single-stranded-DNA-specific exonuclease